MMNAWNQMAATSQFYLYGRSACTRTGYLKAKESFASPDILENEQLNLSTKVFLVTGANAGIGREVTTYLAKKEATVYMICRNPVRARKAHQEIVEQTKNQKLFLLFGDCGVEADVRRVVAEVVQHQIANGVSKSEEEVHLDAVICNAGALSNERIMSAEGVETTFATHLLFGTYLLGELLLPILTRTPESRLIVVSSGGMYNVPFPSWQTATSVGSRKEYDGQMAYAYAKRGQVLLCEQWAAKHKDKVKIVSCHPGWTGSEGVDAAYGENKKFLEPLRSLWEGSDGICWLAVAPIDLIKEDGGFYLDRSPQRKHIAGPFFSEGSYTKNTAEQVADMMQNLAKWASAATRPSVADITETERQMALTKPLKAMRAPLDMDGYMGVWYVLANNISIFEKACGNSIERYVWNAEKKRVEVEFTYSPDFPTSATLSTQQPSAARKEILQRAFVKNAPTNTHWLLKPKVLGAFWSLNLDYIVLDYPEDGSYVVIGMPDRSLSWVMTRAVPSPHPTCNDPAQSVYGLATPEELEQAASSVPPSSTQSLSVDEKIAFEKSVLARAFKTLAPLGIDTSKIVRVPWTEAYAAEMEEGQKGQKVETKDEASNDGAK